jgi:putative zinc finger/helix-turn-helix YgiT family protein
MLRYCPVCKKDTEWEAVKRKEEIIVRKEPIEVDFELSRCPVCKSEFEDMNTDYDPYAKAYEVYRNQHSFLQPKQIMDFRKNYNFTQKELSALLGFGDITLSRYENGSLQDEPHDRLLRFIMKPDNLLEVVHQKVDQIDPKKVDDLLAKLKIEVLMRNCLQNINEYDKSIYSGNKKFDIEKVINVIKFLTSGYGVFKTKLLKLLFYVDFRYYKKYQTSITGMQYARLPLGPVPNDYNILLGIISDIDKTIESEETSIGKQTGEVIISSSPFNPSSFSSPELETIVFVDSFFKEYTSAAIKDYSHNEKAYILTPHAKLISYIYAKDLSI